MVIKQWLIGDAVALDELGNAIGNGNAHETISAHCGSQIAAQIPCRFCRIVCKVLGFFWPDHCLKAWQAERSMVLAARGLPGEKP